MAEDNLSTNSGEFWLYGYGYVPDPSRPPPPDPCWSPSW